MPIETIKLYVNNFTSEINNWSKTGSTPYLDAQGDNSYISENRHKYTDCCYEFENSPITDLIKKVSLDLYMWADDTGEQIEVELWTNGQYRTYMFTPSTTGNWQEKDVSDFLDTWAKINVAYIRVRKISPLALIEYPFDDIIEPPSLWSSVGTAPPFEAPDDGSYAEADDDGADTGYLYVRTLDPNHFIDLFDYYPYGDLYANVKIKVVGSGSGAGELDVYIKTLATGERLLATIVPPDTEQTLLVGNLTVDELSDWNNLQVRLVWRKLTAAPRKVTVDYLYVDLHVRDNTDSVTIDTARLTVEYYPAGATEEKDPASTEIEVAGWNNPENAYLSDDLRTNSSTIGSIQRYGNYGFSSDIINSPEIYDVYVKVEGYYFSDGTTDALKVGVSWDGGATWADYLVSITDVEQVVEVRVTDATEWNGNKLKDEKFRVRITAGQVGCLLLDSLVALWIEDEEERKKLKGECKSISVKELLTLKPLPKLLGYENGQFKPASIRKLELLEGDFDCYRITCEDQNGYIKRASGTGDHSVYLWFKGLTKLRDIEVGNVLGGLYWNEEKQDYELRPTIVKSIEKFTRTKCVHLETDCKHFFTFTIKASWVKW